MYTHYMHIHLRNAGQRFADDLDDELHQAPEAEGLEDFNTCMYIYIYIYIYMAILYMYGYIGI